MSEENKLVLNSISEQSKCFPFHPLHDAHISFKLPYWHPYSLGIITHSKVSEPPVSHLLTNRPMDQITGHKEKEVSQNVCIKTLPTVLLYCLITSHGLWSQLNCGESKFTKGVKCRGVRTGADDRYKKTWTNNQSYEILQDVFCCNSLQF